MLPETLILLLNGALALAQAQQQLSLGSLSSFNTKNLSDLSSFSLPRQDTLTVSVALCSALSQSSLPRFFVTNGSGSIDENDIAHGSPDLFEISLEHGFGNWTGHFPNGGALAVEKSLTAYSFEIGISSSEPLHQLLHEIPYFGDTTSNQAILFSPPFAEASLPRPTYPNFTLPAANLPQPIPPSNSPNFTLFLAPSSNNQLPGPQTGCFISSQQSSGSIANQSLWLRDIKGWRTQWLVGGLTPATNYTAYTVRDGTKVSGPIYFTTKTAAFSCPLVASLPYCPGVAYAVPLPPPPTGSVAYDSDNLPTAITAPLLSYLTNFTTTLTTFACGRDMYSPLVGCDDCQREFRRWLCTITFARCGEASPSNPNSVSTSIPAPDATGLSAVQPSNNGGVPQQIFSALVPQETSDVGRNKNFPPFQRPYSMLLPCLETCTAVDRACPSFLGFRCPTKRFNAAASYGVGYIDGADGQQGLGVTKAAQDQWGNIWCNLG